MILEVLLQQIIVNFEKNISHMLLELVIPSFIKFLVILFAVYFGLRFLIRLLWPYFVRYITKKAGEKMQNVFKGFQQEPTEANNQPKDVPKKSSKIVGEYVDFEEID